MQPPTTVFPADLKRRLEGMTVLHDSTSSGRGCAIGAASARRSPGAAQSEAPGVSPDFSCASGHQRKVLYANPAIGPHQRASGEEARVLEFLFEHQLKPEYRYAFNWAEGDVLMWEDIGTIPTRSADRARRAPLVKRCQVWRRCLRRSNEAGANGEP